MKILLKGISFKSAEEVKEAKTTTLTKTAEKDKQGHFQQWYNCWQKCVTAEENYFENPMMTDKLTSHILMLLFTFQNNGYNITVASFSC